MLLAANRQGQLAASTLGQSSGVAGATDPAGPLGPSTGTPWVIAPSGFATDDHGGCGDLTSTTDAMGRYSSESDDEFGHKVSEILPSGGAQETWAYNSLGQLTTFTDFDGNVTNDTYDSLGRVSTESVTAAGGQTAYDTLTYTYGQSNPDSEGNYTNTVTDSLSGQTITDKYDVNGNLVQIVSPQGTINYTYNPATGQETEESTSNTDIQYGYDQAGELTSVTVDKLDGNTESPALVTSYGYDLDGRLTTTDNANGTVETRGYNQLSELTSIVDTLGSTTIASFVYTYDQSGHVLTETDLSGRTDKYTYDEDYRLLTQAVNDPASGDSTYTFAYDPVGNRVSETIVTSSGTQNYSYTYDDDNQIITVAGPTTSQEDWYSYDANGSLTEIMDANNNVIASYTWDPWGRMVGASTGGNTVQYTYDANGNRASETVNGTTTAYLNDPNQAYDQVLEEYAPGGVLAATYIRGIDLLFQDRSGTQSYYISDNLGSTRALANSAGALTDTYNYDAFGNVIAHTGSTTNEFLFAGMQFDAPIGQYYDRARDYNPANGDFTSRDSAAADPADPATENYYVYASANPCNNVDPSGHEDFSLGGLAASIAIGGIVGGAISWSQGGSFWEGAAWGALGGGLGYGAFAALGPLLGAEASLAGYYATMFSSGVLAGSSVGGLQSWLAGSGPQDVIFDALEAGIQGGAGALGFGALFRAGAAAWPKVSVQLRAIFSDYWNLSGGISVSEAESAVTSYGFNFEIGVRSRFENSRNAVIIAQKDLVGGEVNRIMLAEEIQHGLDRATREVSKALARGLDNEEFHAQLFQRILNAHAAGGFQFLTAGDTAAIGKLIAALK